jgi:predicted acylesterase/phospholipase RssA
MNGFAAALALLTWLSPPCAARRPVLHLALVSSGEAPERELRSLEPLAQRVRSSVAGRARVVVAFGSYADVISWIEQEKVDGAVVTPGVLALLEARAERSGRRTWRYVGSERTSEGDRSVCVVPEGSPIGGIEKLKLAVQRGEAEVLFADPLSVTGRIMPQRALRRLGVPVSSRDILYTSSHGTSLQMLAAERGAKPRAACVWEKVFDDEPRGSFRALDIPELRDGRSPPDSLLAVGGGRAAALLEKAARRAGVVQDPSWKESAFDVWQAFSEVEELSGEKFLSRVSLDGFASLLVHHLRTYGTPPRLAVVFSGGGAKCSYQVGAIRAIEERLARLREEFHEPRFDIDLVVGTSGGAINAVAAALGAASTPQSYENFTSVWKDLDQSRVIKPSLIVKANMALWFAACQDLLLLALALAWSRRKKKQTTKFWGRALAALGLFQLVLSALPLKPWWLFGENAAGHHLFLWVGWGLPGAGLLQLASGALLVAAHTKWRVTRLREELTVGVLVVLALGLPLLQALRILWGEPTLSGNAGIRELVAEKFPRLVFGPEAPLPPLPSDPDERLQTLSRAVFEGGRLRRDLALTGSRLAQRDSALPADLYFYASASPSGPSPSYGERGVSLRERPNLLFDAMMGSGAIYPVFPARTLKDFPSAGQSADIVDGSFSHRSPIEAAVLWGATHIVLLEASPEEISERGTLAANIGAALNHLYDQAQLLDQYSKQHVTTLTLYPSPPHIGLLDFSGNLIEKSIGRGYEETLGRGASSWAPFRKEPGEPRFLTVH